MRGQASTLAAQQHLRSRARKSRPPPCPLGPQWRRPGTSASSSLMGTPPQHGVHGLADGHLDAELLPTSSFRSRSPARRPRRERDRRRAPPRRGGRPPVARERRRAREHEVADAGEPHHRLALRALGDGEPVISARPRVMSAARARTRSLSPRTRPTRSRSRSSARRTARRRSRRCCGSSGTPRDLLLHRPRRAVRRPIVTRRWQPLRDLLCEARARERAQVRVELAGQLLDEDLVRREQRAVLDALSSSRSKRHGGAAAADGAR